MKSQYMYKNIGKDDEKAERAARREIISLCTLLEKSAGIYCQSGRFVV